MASRIAVRLALAAALAALVAACGSASMTTSSTTSHATAATAATPATSTTTASKPLNFAAAIPPGLPASIPGGTPPAGFVRYHSHGFSFLAPAGYKAAPNGAVGGLPKAVSVVFLTPGGAPLQKASTAIIEGFNPELKFDIDEVATQLQASDSSDPSVTGVHTAVSGVTVDRAQEARIVSERYSTKPPGATAFKRTWLMVLPKPGLLMDLVVVNEPGRGGNLNPASVLGSFRLDP